MLSIHERLHIAFHKPANEEDSEEKNVEEKMVLDPVIIEIVDSESEAGSDQSQSPGSGDGYSNLPPIPLMNPWIILIPPIRSNPHPIPLMN